MNKKEAELHDPFKNEENKSNSPQQTKQVEKEIEVKNILKNLLIYLIEKKNRSFRNFSNHYRISL